MSDKSTKNNKPIKEQDRTRVKKAAILEALVKSLGIKSKACEMVGIDRTTLYSWLDSDEEFKKQVEAIEEVATDFVESKMFENIKNNDGSLIKFYMSTKGRSGGR